MKNKDLQFDRSCHVIYSKQCEKEIKRKIALHYDERERDEVWERVQNKYVEYLAEWRTYLGGKKNFHNVRGGTTDPRASGAHRHLLRLRQVRLYDLRQRRRVR